MAGRRPGHRRHGYSFTLSSGGVSEPDFDGPIFTSAVLKYSPIHKVLAAFYALPMQKSAPAKFCDLKAQNF
jgi:hypothetical protein